MWLVTLFGFVAHWVMLGILNLGNRGEGGAGGEGDKGSKGAGEGGGDKTLSQAQVDAIVQERVAREREKYKDYSDLKKFRDEHQKAADEQVQKDLEAQKEYQKAKEAYEKKITDLSGVVTAKDTTIKDMQISNVLISELMRQGAYVEESMALLKSSAVITESGEIKIKGKDANGIDTQLTIADGVKGFLTSRPHLVKATNRGGGGSNGGENNSGGAGDGQASDLMKLNGEYLQAFQAGNHKRAAELKVKIQQALTLKGNRNAA